MIENKDFEALIGSMTGKAPFSIATRLIMKPKGIMKWYFGKRIIRGFGIRCQAAGKVDGQLQ